MHHKQKVCPKCNSLIGVNNYTRHIKVCNGIRPNQTVYTVTHEGLNCIFCDKLCKNLNSLTQHELRCPKNPNRKSYDCFAKYIRETRVGTTKETNPDVMRSSTSLKKKYEEGYVHPCKGRKHSYEYLYESTNNIEINKWLDYVKTLDVQLPEYETTTYNNAYRVLTKSYSIEGNTVCNLFEHDFIANILLGGNLQKSYTVHHIDHNGLNNDKFNLMIFQYNDDHKRFHNSKYARLVYHEDTHLFTCYLDKETCECDK